VSSQTSSPTTQQQQTTAYGYGETWLDTLGSSGDSTIAAPAPLRWAGEPLAAAAGVGAGWGHTAVVHGDGGAVTLIGRPHDFRNTLKHINTRNLLPFMQHAMRTVSGVVFAKDVAPVMLAAPDGDPWAEVRCGMGALTALRTRTGALYTVGQNYFGQCGIGTSATEVVWQPARVVGFDDGDEEVTGLAVGFEHVVASTRRGALYAWGRGDRGQLGHGDADSFMSAARVVGAGSGLLDVSFTRVAAAVSSSAGVAADGSAWVWGKMAGDAPRDAARGSGAAAGSGSLLMADALLPRRVAFPDPDTRAVDVTLGQAHTSFLAADGSLWMTGLRGRGVLKDDTSAAACVAALRTAASTGMGADGTPLPAQRAALAGVLADAMAEAAASAPPTAPLPELLTQVTPLPIAPGPLAGRTIVALRSSLHHSYAITDDGLVFRWGWAGVVAPVLELLPYHVVDLAPGYCHTVMLGARLPA